MSCVATKDHLLALINAAVDREAFVDLVKTVIIPIFTHTEGLWIEATYCYKASEILHRCVEQFNTYKTSCGHHLTLQMLDGLRLECVKLEERYHRLQHNDTL